MSQGLVMIWRTAAAGAALGLAVGLSGCAPEPSEIAGQPEKGAEVTNPESSWGEPTEAFDATEKTTELPMSFPREQFPIPEDAVIDDTGARGETAWFVVLRAPDSAAAGELWAQIIALGGFTESENADTPEGGRSAVLTNATLNVTALTIPQEDGAVLLSYDLISTVL